jgi:tetratricopeptide (TPR) repeat protein
VRLAIFVAILGLSPEQDAAVAKALRIGDEAYAKREEEGSAAKAVEAYKKAIALDETCVEAQWKAARAHFWIGTHENESAKAAVVFREGIEFAKLAVATDENSLHAHYWLAVLYGLFGMVRGIAQSLHMVEPMKKELEWLNQKDEKFQDGGAHRMLGRMFFKLPGFKGGDNNKAIEHLRRAVELAPKNLLNYFYLAEVYYAESRRKEAKEALLTMLEQPDDPEWLPENKQQREDAKRLLAVLEKE